MFVFYYKKLHLGANISSILGKYCQGLISIYVSKYKHHDIDTIKVLNCNNILRKFRQKSVNIYFLLKF